MDLYGINGNTIAMGNARREQVRELNERIQQHNTDVANELTEIADQKKTSEKIRDAQDAAKAVWAGSHMPDKIKKFNDWKTSREAKSNPIANEAEQQSERVEEAGPPAEVETPPEEAPAAEELASRTGAAASEAEEGLGSIAKTTLGNVGEAAATEGLSGAKAALKEGAVKALGKVATAGGGIMAAAQGGMDIYEDIKSGGIAGNNNWEKAGNLLQIGGSIADVAGTVFPPAALLGGVLDIASLASTGIGDQLEEDQEDDTLKQQQQESKVEQVAAPIRETVATGRVS